MRRTCEGILVCHEHNHPHILMLQIANAFFKLYAPSVPLSCSCQQKLAYMFDRPGDYLQASDDEISGFKQRLNERLAPSGNQFTGNGVNDEWQIGDTLAQWWRPNFETFMYPFLPAHVTRPKECKKLYFIQLPKSSTSLFCSRLLSGSCRLLNLCNRSPQCSEEHETPRRPSL